METVGLHVGLPAPGRGWSKRKPEDRKRQGETLVTWAEKSGVSLSDEFRAMIQGGFGPTSSGEDRFDSTIDLMSMLEVVLGRRSEGAQENDTGQRVECWIPGQADRSGRY